jgi:hypothetical protein
MKKSLLAVSLFLAVTSFTSVRAAEVESKSSTTTETQVDTPEGKKVRKETHTDSVEVFEPSITGIGNRVGSDHFLSVGVLAGFGGYDLIFLSSFNTGFVAGVTFWNHLELALNYGLHFTPPSVSSLLFTGFFHQFYLDVLYRTATGHGFFIGPSVGLLNGSLVFSFFGSSIPVTGTYFAYGLKLGYDFRLTNYLSLGLQAGFLGSAMIAGGSWTWERHSSSGFSGGSTA